MIGYQPLGIKPNFFRYVCANPSATREDIDFLLSEIIRLGVAEDRKSSYTCVGSPKKWPSSNSITPWLVCIILIILSCSQYFSIGSLHFIAYVDATLLSYLISVIDLFSQKLLTISRWSFLESCSSPLSFSSSLFVDVDIKIQLILQHLVAFSARLDNCQLFLLFSNWVSDMYFSQIDKTGMHINFQPSAVKAAALKSIIFFYYLIFFSPVDSI